MERTQLSENGQVIIPEVIRRALHWYAGQELMAVNTGEGVLLTSKKLFEPTDIDDVAGCLKYSGAAKTLDEMNEAIAKGVRQTYANRDIALVPTLCAGMQTVRSAFDCLNRDLQD